MEQIWKTQLEEERTERSMGQTQECSIPDCNHLNSVTRVEDSYYSACRSLQGSRSHWQQPPHLQRQTRGWKLSDTWKKTGLHVVKRELEVYELIHSHMVYWKAFDFTSMLMPGRNVKRAVRCKQRNKRTEQKREPGMRNGEYLRSRLI